MKARCLNAIICLIVLVFFCILACDNGSVSDSASSNTSGLVKVSLAVDGDYSNILKSISVTSDISNFTYFYKAEPKWSQTLPIHGSTNGQFVQIPGYSPSSPAPVSLGYFTAGQWEFTIEVRNGGTVLYRGSSVESIYQNLSINVIVSKIAAQASGSVSVSVTAPTVQGDSLIISYTGVTKGEPPVEVSGGYTIATNDNEHVSRSNGISTFEYSFSDPPLAAGIYTFTLKHNSTGSGAAVAIDLRQGERVEITGHLENGVWQVGYITVKVHEISINTLYKENPEDPGVSNCTVKINIPVAAAGEKVSFYVIAAKGSRKEEVSYTVGNVKTHLQPEDGSGLYTFIMPDNDITINAIYSATDSNINIYYFRALFEMLYNANPNAISFGRSLIGPPLGVEYFETKDVALWCETDHEGKKRIWWHNEPGKFKFTDGSMKDFFKNCNSFKTIDLSGMNTSDIDDMSGMFQDCTSLENITFDEKDANGNFKNFNTSNVESMSSMFENCVDLVSLDVTGFDTRKVESMSRMFKGCERLTEIVLDTEEKDANGKFLHFNTANVTDMSYMFCSKTVEAQNVKPSAMSLATLNVSGLDTSSVTNMSYMFYMCWQLSELIVSGFRTSNVTDMSNMFACYNFNGVSCPGHLPSLDLSDWDFKNVTTTAKMFDRQENLASFSFPETTDFRSLTTMTYMFSHCLALTPEVFRDIVKTWTFAQHPLFATGGIYGQTTTSFFGSHDDTINNATAARNYIFRNSMTKKDNNYPEYGKFDNREPEDENHQVINYVTKDGEQLWIGGNSKDNKYAKLTVFKNVNQ